MPEAIRSSTRARSGVVPALMAAVVAASAMGSCITVPPADPPQVPPEAPVIIQDAVQPPVTQYLTTLQLEFIIPMRVTGPMFDCRVFVDFDTGINNESLYASGVAAYPCLAAQPALDGGLTTVRFSLPETSLGDPTACHFIQFFVADSFQAMSAHTPGDNLGADSVTWQYAPNGPGGCMRIDGGFPVDASVDAPLVVPE